MEIMAIQKELLFGNDYFEGFRPANEVNYLSRILKNSVWMERSSVEKDARYKQPIAYTMIINPNPKRVFIYQRASLISTKRENRLRGNFSYGIGGHIEKIDLQSVNPVEVSMLREMQEEVGIKNPIKAEILGYINNDRDEVGKVHFGILYVVETDLEIIKPKDPEIEWGELKTPNDLNKIYFSSDIQIEEWSRIAFSPLKIYLS